MITPNGFYCQTHARDVIKSDGLVTVTKLNRFVHTGRSSRKQTWCFQPTVWRISVAGHVQDVFPCKKITMGFRLVLNYQ
nr:unnamed protein product [Spirometra erinaceieuropaei]